MTLTYYKDYQELFSGILSYWDGSSSGTTLYDIIGSYNGTLVGSPSVTTNKFGYQKALNLESNSSKYVALSGDLIGDVTNAFSIIAMVKLTDGKSGVIYSESLSSNTLNPYWTFNIIDGTYPIRISTRSNTNAESSAYVTQFSGITANVWHVFGISHTENSTTWNFFSNGVKCSVTGTLTTTSNTDRGRLWVLHRSTSFGGYFDGYTGSVLIFNTAKSDDEMIELSRLLSQKMLYPIQSGVRGVE